MALSHKRNISEASHTIQVILLYYSIEIVLGKTILRIRIVYIFFVGRIAYTL